MVSKKNNPFCYLLGKRVDVWISHPFQQYIQLLKQMLPVQVSRELSSPCRKMFCNERNVLSLHGSRWQPLATVGLPFTAICGWWLPWCSSRIFSNVVHVPWNYNCFIFQYITSLWKILWLWVPITFFDHETSYFPNLSLFRFSELYLSLVSVDKKTVKYLLVCFLLIWSK